MRRLLPLAAVLAAATLAPAGASAAAWSAPQTVSAPHTFAGPLAVTQTYGGATLVAWPWQQNVGTNAAGGAAFAVRPPSVGASPSSFMPEHTAPAGLLDVGPFATAQALGLAAQARPGRPGPTGAILYDINIAFYHLGLAAPYGSPRTLATAPVIGLPQLASAAGSATALVSYIEVTKTSSGAIRRVVRAVDRRSGAWGKPYTLSGRGRADVLTAAAGTRGDQVVAFVRQGDLLARVRRHGHGWGSIQRLARATGPTQWQLAAGVDDRGQVRVVWRRHQLRTSGVAGRTALESAAMLVGRGTFTAAQTLTADGASGPRLAPIPGGWAVADVETTADGPRPALHRTTGGSQFGPVAYAAPGQGGARGADVTWSALDGITVAWVQPVTDQDSDGVARAASLDPAAPAPAFGPVEDVSPAEAVHEVRLSTDPRAGRPIAMWTARPEGTGPSIPIAQIRTFVRAAVRTP